MLMNQKMRTVVGTPRTHQRSPPTLHRRGWAYAGTLTLVARQGKIAYFELQGHLEIERKQAGHAGLDLPYLFDDQADRERGIR